MEFLYGDSTPSPLGTDYVDFLRKSLECCVSLLQAEQRMAQGTARRTQLEATSEREVARLRELEATVSRAIGLSISGVTPDAPVARCSDVIARAASSAVALSEGELKSGLAAEVQRIDESAAKERGRCLKAFEQLLLAHDLPGSVCDLRLVPRKEGGLVARLHAATPYGVNAVIELEIPRGSWFAQPLSVGDVVDTLEIHVPKTAGWLRKESKLATEKLTRLAVTSCSIGSRGKRVSIRGEGLEEGYDFACAAGDTRIQATRVAAEAPAPVEFELSEADVKAVQAFVDNLTAAAQALVPNRKSLVSAELDGAPFEDQREPSVFVQRLIELMAPTVREIAARSGSEGELVIRRLLGDGRREERFVRRAELLEKLEPLPAAGRAMFVPLGLGQIAGPPPPDDFSEISSGYVVEEGGVAGALADATEASRPPPLRTPS